MNMLNCTLQARMHRFTAALAAAGWLCVPSTTPAATTLADQPVLSSTAVPGNLALALSVEFPTAVSVAHTDSTYSPTNTYIGYFDPTKCYLYQAYAPETATQKSHFYPAGVASSHTCVGDNDQMWSGNFMNWSTMQTIDPFRWALTGGYRVVDTSSLTILEKAYATGQGGSGNFPNRTVSDTTTLAGATPFSGGTYVSRIYGLGARMTMVTPGQTGSILGMYYNNTTLTGTPVMTRFDTVNFDWGTASPGGAVNTDNFSVRWTVNSIAPSTGTYSFQTVSDDGVRLYVNGNLVIDNWTTHSATTNTSANISMNSGDKLDIRLEYFDATGPASVKLYWMAPGTSTYSIFQPPADSQNTGSNPPVADPQLYIRVKVCDATAPGGVEANCTLYPAGNYKPTGLMQQYASKIRYSAFGYLNDGNLSRDGGVLRARQKFVGPTYTIPTQPETTNAATEWDASTGVMTINPDATDASNTATQFGVSVTNSGVLNYLNKFGEINPGSYKTYDPVSELYYAAIRYFKNLGNVPEWTNMTGASTATKTTYVDGFPVITTWDDPILYSCQRNFVLGIGDVNTHADKNVAGSTRTEQEPTKPATVTADTSVDAVTATNKVGSLHGLGSSLGTAINYNGCCNSNSALIAGLAYDSNTVDIRPDDATKPQTIGMQTVQTYWLDVLEYQTYKKDNQYYLATKYGGFKAPSNYSPYTQATDIPQAWWSTSGQTVGSGSTAQPKPDNYYTSAKADQMVAGLTSAFSSIANQLTAYTTSFSTSLPQVSSTGVASYSSKYDANNWTGEVTASTSSFDPTTGEPSQVAVWSFSNTLAAQVAGTGWTDSRRVVTWNTTTLAAVPFRSTSISTDQLTALDTSYRSGADGSDYLNYLRGDRSQEANSTVSGSSQAYRVRQKLVGDIVRSKARVVGAPSAAYASAANPGYGDFKTTYANRTTMVYVGANDGMLHAIDGSLTGSTAGQEVFAYVPGLLYQGPNSTPQVDGLASIGNPSFVHHAMVDGNATVVDVDFGRTNGGSGTTDWRTILVGALGKGGKGYYAIDVTDPSAMTSETAVAGKVLWEFTDSTLGFTFGDPVVVKTRKWGWVLVFGSGYNNSDGQGYFYFVNPRTGALLEKVGTGAGSTSSDAGLAHVQPFVLDRTDNTADAVYAGDLLGNLWRLDVTATSGSYPSPVQLAKLTDGSGTALPVTSRPLPVVQPGTNTRWITVGTGQLLSSGDISNSQDQAFFAIQDGTGLAFGTATSLPTGMSYPILNSNLHRLTDLTVPVTLNPATEIGWWFDLGTSSSRGWRVIADPTSFYGSVSFSAMLPNGDACNPSGSSRVYVIDLGSGQSQLVSGSTVLSYSTAVSGSVTDLRFYSVNDGSGNATRRLIVCSDTGVCKSPDLAPTTSQSLRRLNWRELPLAD